MSADLKLEIPFDYYTSYDYSPETDYIDSKVHDFIENTHDNYRRQGYFTAPFLVRCVLRDHDGNCLFVSPPKLMTAGLLPPCMDFYDYPEYNRLCLYFRLKGSPVFSLMVRIGRLPDNLANKAKCVDVYVTRQIPAYSYGGGHRGNYSDVLRNMDTDSPLYDGVDLDDFVLMFKGRYSDSECAPAFTKHYNDAKFAQTPVWYVAPNNSLADMLVAETVFHHVASIEAENIIRRRSFQKIPVPSTTNEWIENQKKLEEDPQIKIDEVARAEASPHAKSNTHPPHNAPANPCHNMSGIYNMSGLYGMLGIYRVAAFHAANATSSQPKISFHPPAPRKLILAISSGLSPPLK